MGDYDADFRVNALSVAGVAVPYRYDDDGLLVGAGAEVLARLPSTSQLDVALQPDVSESRFSQPTV